METDKMNDEKYIMNKKHLYSNKNKQIRNNIYSHGVKKYIKLI